MRWLILGLLVGCGDPPPQAPCEERGNPSLELTPSGVSFGDFDSEDPLEFGPPPQGGAPYAAVTARVDGLDLVDGVTIALSAVDLDSSEDLGELSYETRLVCANVGDSAGTWLATDVHHRFFGFELDELGGRMAEVTMTITDSEGESVDASIVATLEEEL